MTMTRRGTLLGLTAAATAAALPKKLMAALIGPRRPPLWPLGALQLHYPGDRGYLMMMGRWHRGPFPSIAQDPSQEQQTAAVLNIYRRLVEDVVIDGLDLDSLSLQQRNELIAIRRHFIRAPKDRINFVRHDHAVCRWLDREVSKIVDDSWRVTPSESAARNRALLVATRSELVIA